MLTARCIIKKRKKKTGLVGLLLIMNFTGKESLIIDWNICHTLAVEIRQSLGKHAITYSDMTVCCKFTKAKGEGNANLQFIS